MNGFWGADTEALRTMGDVLQRRANLLSDLEGRLSSTIDSVEWVGEDAEQFRAEWSRLVRSGLQDREVELRIQARRLGAHADEQDGASAPDGWTGGWSSPVEFLHDVTRLVAEVCIGLFRGDEPLSWLPRGPFADLLREVLSTPEGCAMYLGNFLGSVLGGLLAEMITRAIEIGLALENLLTGLGLAAGLSNLLGALGEGPAAPVEAPAPAAEALPAGGSESSPAGGEAGAAESGDAGATGGSGGGAGGGGSSGGGSGGGSEGGGGEAPAAVEAADGTALPTATEHLGGHRATADGAAQTGAAWGSGRIVAAAAEEPKSLLERLLEMVGGAMDLGGSTTSSVGEDIGFSTMGGTGR